MKNLASIFVALLVYVPVVTAQKVTIRFEGLANADNNSAQAYIADVTTKENRAKGMGLIGAAFGLGFVFGPAIGGILSRWGINVPFLFAGALALANVVLLYFALPETVTPDHPARVSAASGRGWSQLIGAFRQPALASVMTIYFLGIVAFSIMTASFSVFMMFRMGYDAFHNGWIFAFVGVISAIIQGGLIGRLVKKFGEPWLVIAGAFLFTASLVLLPLMRPSASLVTVLSIAAVTSIGQALSAPTLSSMMTKINSTMIAPV